MYKKQNCSIIPKSSFQYNDCYDYEYYNCHKNIHRVYMYGNYNYYYNMYHNIDTKWCNPCNNSHKKTGCKPCSKQGCNPCRKPDCNPCYKPCYYPCCR